MDFDLLSTGLADKNEAITQIAWFEGLQLLPQHFQSLDARLDGLLRRKMLSSSPYSWGIDRLKIDAQVLGRGILRLALVAGCFPDGLIFAWNSLRDGTVECALEIDTDTIRYALAVPREDFAEKGIDVGRYTQFVAPPLADRANRDEKAVIVRLLPNLSIRRWDALNPLYVQIPFIEVTKTATGFVATSFHPPAVRLIPGSSCEEEVANLIRLLRTKATQLSTLPVPTLLNSEYGPGLNWILSLLTSGLPRLEVQLAGMVTHPYELFLSLCVIAGAVSALRGKAPDYFPPYNHADLSASISGVVEFISEIVQPIGMNPSRWSEDPFIFADGEWTGSVSTRPKQGELLILVVFDQETAESTVSSWVQHALICFSDEKNRCRQARVRGLVRRKQSTLEVGLEATPGQCYICVDVTGVFEATEKKLIIAGSDERSGLTLARVSLMKLAD